MGQEIGRFCVAQLHHIKVSPPRRERPLQSNRFSTLNDGSWRKAIVSLPGSHVDLSSEW
jgi:hypothetical protein